MASSLTEAQVELINSLAPDDIPIKLRCAICSKLAVDAYRLPCCEQAICETCHSNLPDGCPICEHSPLSAEDCNPNKSLRTTIKVFIRTAEKKREAARALEIKESAPTTPVEARKPSVSGFTAPEAPAQETPDLAGKQTEEKLAPEVQDNAPATSKAEQPKQESSAHVENTPTEDERRDEGHQVLEGTKREPDTVEGEQEINDQEAEEGMNLMNGGYNNMNLGGGTGDFNQMQMMMAMQNGMNPAAFGGFPMMGMAGMNMDPVQMQNMYMNGGFQGMGMNGMGGFGGGFGQGSNNWNNGAQQWNSFDQNNYNQNGAGMGSGDFGGFNSGFQSSYNNQGNYGHFNDYRRGFGRGRGRGRGFFGGYGRGGYQQYGNGPYQEQGRFPTQQHGQNQLAQQQIGDAKNQKQTDDLGRDVPRNAEDNQNEGGPQEASVTASHENAGSKTSGPNSNGPSAIPSVLSAPDVPLNAPTGPKAMRQGLPNTSLHHLRARGYQVGTSVGGGQGSQSGSRPHTPLQGQQPVVQETSGHSTPKGHDNADNDTYDQERGRSATRDHEGPKDDQRSRSRSRSEKSRSRSREHKDSRRHRRYRSGSVDDDGGSDHHRKKHRSSKRSTHHPDETIEDEFDPRTREREQKPSDRSRSQSASGGESRRSSHRSRRHRDRERRDKDRDRPRDRDREREDDRKKSSSHRSLRDRDHEPSSRRRDRDKDRDSKDKDRDRRRDRDRRDRHRVEDREDRPPADNSRRHTVGDENSASAQDFKPPSGPRGFDIKESSSRGATGTKDAHTLEREARDRERLLKEAQRMAGMAGSRGSGGGSRKRGRDDGDEGGGGRKSRRSSRREDGGEEERMRRGEEEREESRWD